MLFRTVMLQTFIAAMCLAVNILPALGAAPSRVAFASQDHLAPDPAEPERMRGDPSASLPSDPLLLALRSAGVTRASGDGLLVSGGEAEIQLPQVPIKSVLDSPEEGFDLDVRGECMKIAKQLASVIDQDCEKPGLQHTGAYSVKGRPILEKIYPPLSSRKPKGRVLLIGGIHADELTSVSIVFRWMRILDKHHSGLYHWKIVPALNPDGLLLEAARRTNANGVDLNRNFPTPDWTQQALLDYWIKRTKRNPRRFPGSAPLSEPESLWLAEEIEHFRPDAIISVHAPFGIVDFDGPPHAPTKLGRLMLNPLGTYPGSLGNYAGLQKRIPIVTIELPYAAIMPSELETRRMWMDLVRWLQSNVPNQVHPVYAESEQESLPQAPNL